MEACCVPLRARLLSVNMLAVRGTRVIMPEVCSFLLLSVFLSVVFDGLFISR